MGARYIITMTDYLTRWEEAAAVTDCTIVTATRFLFDNVVTRFGFSKVLMSDEGSHFINHTISAMIEEFNIQHKKITPYHLQANGTVEAFNKVLEHALTKVYNASRDDWDLTILVILWDYQTTCKCFTC